MGYLAEMYKQFKDRAEFLTVYVREAHPQDEWQMKANVTEGTCYLQPRSLGDRVVIANDFVKRFQYPIPLGIDSMADTAMRIYGGWPERLYVIDESGRIVYKGGMGPYPIPPGRSPRLAGEAFPRSGKESVVPRSP